MYTTVLLHGIHDGPDSVDILNMVFFQLIHVALLLILTGTDRPELHTISFPRFTNAFACTFAILAARADIYATAFLFLLQGAAILTAAP